mmetsp:Transcript_74235/g.172206  ORF Transcript_74235/g.172206 Transcript_74235/m.172206 type:complete len:412 (+) Transcript_74235:502-1737(+)
MMRLEVITAGSTTLLQTLSSRMKPPSEMRPLAPDRLSMCAKKARNFSGPRSPFELPCMYSTNSVSSICPSPLMSMSAKKDSMANFLSFIWLRNMPRTCVRTFSCSRPLRCTSAMRPFSTAAMTRPCRALSLSRDMLNFLASNCVNSANSGDTESSATSSSRRSRSFPRCSPTVSLKVVISLTTEDKSSRLMLLAPRPTIGRTFSSAVATSDSKASKPPVPVTIVRVFSSTTARASSNSRCKTARRSASTRSLASRWTLNSRLRFWSRAMPMAAISCRNFARGTPSWSLPGWSNSTNLSTVVPSSSKSSSDLANTRMASFVQWPLPFTSYRSKSASSSATLSLAAILRTALAFAACASSSKPSARVAESSAREASFMSSVRKGPSLSEDGSMVIKPLALMNSWQAACAPCAS